MQTDLLILLYTGFVCFVRLLFYLGVKGIELQLICALEDLGEHLLESDPVQLPVKDVDLLHIDVRASNEVSLPCQGHLSVLCALGSIAAMYK